MNKNNTKRKNEKENKQNQTQYKFIFDMDGTLYQFDGGKSKSFGESTFYANLRVFAIEFIAGELSLTTTAAERLYEELKKAYSGETSLALEYEFDISRYDYFQNTWSRFSPKDYISKNPALPSMFKDLDGRVSVLTAAPRAWAEPVLKYLEVYDFVQNFLYTGEPDIRKPDPEAFLQIARAFGRPANEFISIGDQEYSDIVPAKRAGMKTVIVGSQSENADYQIGTIDDLPILLQQEGLI